MPRRKRDQLAVKIGERLAQLRTERSLTREKLSYEHGIAKGTVSELENGYVRASLPMLERIAAALDVDVIDVLTFPEDNIRHELIDATRNLPVATLRRLLSEATRRR